MKTLFLFLFWILLFLFCRDGASVLCPGVSESLAFYVYFVSLFRFFLFLSLVSRLRPERGGVRLRVSLSLGGGGAGGGSGVVGCASFGAFSLERRRGGPRRAPSPPTPPTPPPAWAPLGSVYIHSKLYMLVFILF